MWWGEKGGGKRTKAAKATDLMPAQQFWRENREGKSEEREALELRECARIFFKAGYNSTGGEESTKRKMGAARGERKGGGVNDAFFHHHEGRKRTHRNS